MFPVTILMYLSLTPTLRFPHSPSCSTSMASAAAAAAAAAAVSGQLRLSLTPNPPGIRHLPSRTLAPHHRCDASPRSSVVSRSSNPSLFQPLATADPPIVSTGGGSSDLPAGPGDNGRGGGGGGNGPWGPQDSDASGGGDRRSGPLGLFVEGWRSRVAADPQFPFKVLMEELVGVSACVLGDMASRPNFGLNELDFVFSTLVVGGIVNFVLMYLLAPTATATAASLPGIFVASPASHMFEPGPYSLVARLGTFVYKGVMFAAVGFAAGLAGTAMSNGLLALRQKMDPTFETPNKAPPTVLNALSWSLHMGVSSNFRYQTLNGIEFVMEKALPPAGFKTVVVLLRSLNNVLGGMSFVVLARLTGSQKASGAAEGKEELKERLVESNVGESEGRDGKSEV